jgi:hypothetical protein
MQFDIVANDRATASMAKVEKSAESFGKKLGASFTVAAAKAAALLMTFNKISEWVGKQGDIADEAAKLGLSPETYQRLSFAAKDYGMDISQVAMALKDVNTLLDVAATKKGPEMKALQALGFSDAEILNRTIKQEEVMQRMAEAIGEATSEEEKFAMATRIVGSRVAQSIVPILSDYENFLKLQQELTVTTSENATAFDILGTKISKAGQNLSGEFANFVGWSAKKLGIITDEDTAKPERTEAQRARARAMKDAVLAADARDGKDKSDSTAGMAVTSLQQIGGGIARGPSTLESYAARTAQATETIAVNTAPKAAAPATGSTDLTKPNIKDAGDFIKGTMPKPTPKPSIAPGFNPFTDSKRPKLTRTF